MRGNERLRWARIGLAALALSPAWAWLAGGCGRARPARPVVDPRRAAMQMALGNPSNAITDPHQSRNYLLLRPQYAISVNDGVGIPNWVSWRLCASDIGGVERGQFAPDPVLGTGFSSVTPEHYTNSGWERGHMCPSRDRSATREDNDVTFYMSNVVPQARGLNQGPWLALENECRRLAQAGNELYITCGPAGGARSLRSGILIPEACWKVVVVLRDEEGDDLARIGGDTRVIAVMMPNNNRIEGTDWREHRVSVSEIEDATQLEFFTNLPADLQSRLKNVVDRE